MEKEQTETKETNETKEVKQEIPKGYYLAKIPTQYGIIMMKEEKEVSTQDLLIKMANALKDNGIMKD